MHKCAVASCSFSAKIVTFLHMASKCIPYTRLSSLSQANKVCVLLMQVCTRTCLHIHYIHVHVVVYCFLPGYRGRVNKGSCFQEVVQLCALYICY